LSDDLSDEVSTESEVLTDMDGINTDIDSLKQDNDVADKDTQPDESNDIELPDYDYPAGKEGDSGCPSLLNAGFPYKDGDGKITFCRKCDLPAPANDPQCVRNLWEMNNRRIMEEYPETYCYPLPCDVTKKAGITVAPAIGKCDIDATGKIYQGSTGVFKQGDISDGKIGMYVTASKKVDGKYIVIGSLHYDIATQKYTMVAHASSKQAFRNNRFIFTGANWSDKQNYVISASKVENGWKYEAVYANEWNKIEFIYPPAVGENFVLMNVQKAVNVGEDAGPQNILYASVKDWNWKKLGEGQIMDPSIVQDTAFFNYNKSIWACDLTKSPTDIATGCRKVSRDGEKATAPAVKKGSKNFVIYSAGEGYYQVVMADLTNEIITYKQLDMMITPDLISFAPGQWDGDILAFDELYQFSEVDIDFRTCYYSISKNKKVCFPNPSSYGKPMGYIYAGVEGKYITYQPTGAIILKDMECQCKEYPDQCLYNEYMPETPVLKKK
ncbi:MAG TPA: hypothetical protein PLX56_08290, partial [bacterium]|nr:hypothetical protein [bacterium]